MGIWLANNIQRCLVLLAACASFTACDIINPEEPIPHYLYVEGIQFSADEASEGTSSHKLTDVWVIQNGNFVGAFTPPATIPIMMEGDDEVSLSAGIKDNGISTTRVRYPFANRLDFTLSAAPGGMDSLSKNDLTFGYDDNTKFLIIEDFEGSSIGWQALNNNLNNFFVTNNPSEVIEGKGSLKIVMNDQDSGFAIQTFKTFNRNDFNFGAPVYVELDYRTDVPFFMGYLITDGVGFTSGEEHMVINTSSARNKIYINITTRVAALMEDQTIKIFFQGFLPSSMDDATIYLDNFKLVTFE